MDLSAASLTSAHKAVERAERRAKHSVDFTQANLLSLPFAAESFEFVVTCGALEYVPLEAGMKELSRVLAPGGYLLHVPIRPSFVSTMWETLFRFKMHAPAHIEDVTSRHFRILDRYQFPSLDPIGWTKTAILSQKS
jgi:ubiquinone/menaquinone biosynthesis C-methylase UbiE